MADTAFRRDKDEQFLGCQVRSTCLKPLRLSVHDLNRHLVIPSRVFSVLMILPEWFWVFLLTSPQSPMISATAFSQNSKRQQKEVFCGE